MRNIKRVDSYAKEAQVHCTDNGRDLLCDVIQFNPGKFLTVSVEGKVNIDLRYVEKFDHYVGTMAKLEFTSSGPKRIW